MRFFYRGATMLLTTVHMDVCDCLMCIHLIAPPVTHFPKPKNPPTKKSPPLGMGRHSPYTTKKPTPTPSHRSPTWSPCRWPSPSPQPTGWDEIPTTQTRPLEYVPLATKPRTIETTKDINKECDKFIDVIHSYPEVKNEFMEDLPKKSSHRNHTQAYRTRNKLRRAIEILDEVFIKHKSFAYAYTCWVGYNQCCKNQAHFAPETYCSHCSAKISHLKERFKEWVHSEEWDNIVV